MKSRKEKKKNIIKRTHQDRGFPDPGVRLTTVSDERRTRDTPVSHSCRMLHEGNRAPAEKRGQVWKGWAGAVTAARLTLLVNRTPTYTLGGRAATRRTVQYSIFYSFQFPNRIRKDEDVHSPVELWSDHISGGGDRHVMPSLSEQ